MPGRLRVVDAEVLEAKRRLRARSARLRRRIDRRLATVRHERTRLASWQTYVRRFPLGALVAGLGLGITVSAGFSPRRLSRWLGTSLLGAAMSAVRQGIWRDVMKLWDSVESVGSRGDSKD
jgi:hypothetical protein